MATYIGSRPVHAGTIIFLYRYRLGHYHLLIIITGNWKARVNPAPHWQGKGFGLVAGMGKNALFKYVGKNSIDKDVPGGHYDWPVSMENRGRILLELWKPSKTKLLWIQYARLRTVQADLNRPLTVCHSNILPVPVWLSTYWKRDRIFFCRFKLWSPTKKFSRI